MKYTVMSAHYGKQPQAMDGGEFDNKAEAEHFIQQQAAIIRGYKKRTGFFDGAFCVFGVEDTIRTRIYIRESK